MWKYAKKRGYGQVELGQCALSRGLDHPQKAHTSSKRDLVYFGSGYVIGGMGQGFGRCLDVTYRIMIRTEGCSLKYSMFLELKRLFLSSVSCGVEMEGMAAYESIIIISLVEMKPPDSP